MMSSGSESEGEIIETEAEKATTALPSVNGSHVDSQSRSRPGSASASPRATLDGGSERYRSRSPYRHDRSPRGEKRRREEDYYDERDYSDPRRFKVYYENHQSSDETRRSRISYADLERSEASAPGSGKSSRNSRGGGHWDSRARTRSRSPRYHGESNDRKGRYGKVHEMPRRNFDDRRGKDRERDRPRRKEQTNRAGREHPDKEPMSNVSNSRQPRNTEAHLHDKDLHVSNKQLPSAAQE
jgi:serine/threonine-protein kinase PRP4